MSVRLTTVGLAEGMGVSESWAYRILRRNFNPEKVGSIVIWPSEALMFAEKFRAEKEAKVPSLRKGKGGKCKSNCSPAASECFSNRAGRTGER